VGSGKSAEEARRVCGEKLKRCVEATNNGLGCPGW
jgi:hypothetical protein